ncbi:MAG: SET domain-containing protein-lysine N-methyltransferase [Actinobacteria bacterium]|nr:SET domain-containing protein-lysine N-methyltransferase [Actinomycetota bacterium]
MAGKRRYTVRRSPIHGSGVFAAAPIAAGDWIVEYLGELITWDEAVERSEDHPSGHTFYFDRGDGWVIDGGVSGNSARWINHGCEPNCEATDDEGRILIHAMRDLEPGEELLIDYRLHVDGRKTKALKQMYACHCGAASCRGTMLA